MSTTISRDWSYKPASTNFTANFGAPPCITTEMGDIWTYNRQLEDLRSQSCQSPEKSLKSVVYWSGKASFINDWFWPIESIQITYTLYDFLRFNVPLMAIVHDVSKLGKTSFIKLFIKVHEFFKKWYPHHSSIFQAHFLIFSQEFPGKNIYCTGTVPTKCPKSAATG